ncbi:MAG: hypothetical protein NT129_00865 [Candidatus Aenigmarchaeota archaeon]|nr:hypothetical protein [Candidatus Aenigmarchaeota archaeon]
MKKLIGIATLALLATGVFTTADDRRRYIMLKPEVTPHIPQLPKVAD